MKLQEQQPSDLSIHKILKDANRREAVVKSLLQALSSFGYTETIKSLQKQSKIILQKSRIQKIQVLLKQYCYKAAYQQIQLLGLNSSVKLKLREKLQQLELIHLISLGKVQDALSFLSQSHMNEQSKLNYCQMIALDGLVIPSNFFQTKNKEILQKCQIQVMNEKNVKKILTQFLQNDAVDEQKRKIEAPKIVTAESKQNIHMVGKVNFIKFNKKGNKIGLVSEDDGQYELTIWQIKNAQIIKKQSYKDRTIGFITSVKWNQQQLNEFIGICSYQNVIIFKTNKLSIAFAVSRSQLSLPRFLCFGWNPISQIIYIGGLSSKLLGVDSFGDIVSQVNPFLPSRELVFSPKGELFTIAAMKEGRLIKYSLDQEKIQKEFVVRSIFMDLKYQQQKLILSNQEYIYVIASSTLIPIYTIDSPLNQNSFKIQAFFCGPWIVSYNQKLRATLKFQRLVRQVKWQNCNAVDIQGKRIVTCKQSIKIWQSLQQSQQQQYQQIQSSGQRESSSVSQSSVQPQSSSEQNVDVSEQSYRQMMQIQYINVQQQIEDNQSQ